MSALAIKECLIVEFPLAIRMVPESAKVIAFNIDTTPRAIEGQRQGEHLPSLPVGLALARQYPHIKKLFMKLMDAETGESGDDPARIVDEIHRLTQKLMEARG
jgi:hypothetical protein